MDRHKIVAGAAGMAVGCGTVWATYFDEENRSGGGQHACLTSNSGTKETAARLASGLPGPVLADLITAKKDAPLARILPKFDIVLSPANSSGGGPVVGGIAGVGGAAGVKRKKGGRKAGGNYFLDGAEEADSWDTELPALMPMAEIQQHVEAASRVAVSPSFSEEACSALHAYYLVIRRAKVDQDVGDVSLLTLESLIRVAIACAKLCMRCEMMVPGRVFLSCLCGIFVRWAKVDQDVGDVSLLTLESLIRVAIACAKLCTSYQDASAQLSRAVEGGVNFFDTAEMYPVPQRAETQGSSEAYLGRWLAASGIPRDKLIFATKVAGPSAHMTWIRGGPCALDPVNMAALLPPSLPSPPLPSPPLQSPPLPSLALQKPFR
ncbi:unnamed protein product [Closterium sp. Naga37s-1]|nr:unnamed protein product [Closterium sp. Naga37s-1]